MKVLFLLFFIFLFMIFAFGFSFIRFIFRLLFGWRNNQNAGRQQSSSRAQQSKEYYSDTKNNPSKIFHSDEGEYIDYEEIK